MRFLEVEHPEYRPPADTPATPEELYCWTFRPGIGYIISHQPPSIYSGLDDPFRYWREEADRAVKDAQTEMIRLEVEAMLYRFRKDQPPS
jgi:hypothetical protein